jgi:hypothetical protein
LRDELIKAIRERTGFDESIIEPVLAVAVDYLTKQLPPEMAPMLAMMLGTPAGSSRTETAQSEGEAPGLPDLGDLLGGLMKPRGN